MGLDSLSYLRASLDRLKEQNLYRQLRPLVLDRPSRGGWVQMEDGRRLLNLCSNNYLGLSLHPRVIEASRTGAASYGCGSGASRLICGDLALNEKLEERLAAFKGQEAALVFPTGYTANLGLISSLTGAGDQIFSDSLNHASIIDGCRLSRARTTIYGHNDLDHLERELRLAWDSGGRRLIVTDAVFSMDGDLAPLPELVTLSERYECILMVDEAHATGTIGPGGKGLVSHFGLDDRVSVIMGTMSKALGSLGAFAAGSSDLREYLINCSRSFIFTTGLPPSVLASALEALAVLEEEPDLVEKLHQNARYLRKGLVKLGCAVNDYPTPIIPLVLGDSGKTLRAAALLKQEGILATAIRPPTVPEGTSRLRLTVMASHTVNDLDYALQALEKVGQQIDFK